MSECKHHFNILLSIYKASFQGCVSSSRIDKDTRFSSGKQYNLILCVQLFQIPIHKNGNNLAVE